MISLKTDNLFAIENEHGLSMEEFQGKKDLISKYLEKIEKRKQGFYKVIDDQEMVEKINTFEQKTRGQYEHIVVLGIGGSALGTICLQQTLKHLFENELPNSSTPFLHILDNIDPSLIQALEDIIDYPKTLFIVVTKSGSTPETLSQYLYFREQCEIKGLDPKEHFVFITDPKKGPLREITEKENIPSFEIPNADNSTGDIGGRFSVLTPVGLLPAKLIGIDIQRLLEGAGDMRNKFLKSNFEDNPCFQLAEVQYLLAKKGKTINVLMPYSQKLIRFADWYRQLLAESIGKKLNNRGEKIYAGITPVNALGATDQHSQSQLYNEGPNDKLIIFLELENYGPELKIPGKNAPDYLKNTSFNELLRIEKQATAQSLTKNNRPNITILVDSIREEELGELFMLFEGATAFLGEFFEINAFDQPGVELSKELTKKTLNHP